MQAFGALSVELGRNTISGALKLSKISHWYIIASQVEIIILTLVKQCKCHFHYFLY